MNRETWTLSFRAEGAGPPVECRVRRLLKVALRAYGLRCTNYAVAHGDMPGQYAPPDADRQKQSSRRQSGQQTATARPWRRPWREGEGGKCLQGALAPGP